MGGIARFDDLKIEAWLRLSGEQLIREEYLLLWEMDDAYCAIVNKELQNAQQN